MKLEIDDISGAQYTSIIAADVIKGEINEDSIALWAEVDVLRISPTYVVKKNNVTVFRHTKIEKALDQYNSYL